MNNLFVSTGGLRSKTAVEAAEYFNLLGIKSLELSGGAFFADVIQKLQNLEIEGFSL